MIYKLLARRYIPMIIGATQAAFTTGFATAIACARTSETSEFFYKWLPSWCVAYAMTLPIVVLIAPLLRRLAEWLATPDD